jgi:hypothetical protein
VLVAGDVGADGDRNRGHGWVCLLEGLPPGGDKDRRAADGHGLRGGEHEGGQAVAAEPGGLVAAVGSVDQQRNRGSLGTAATCVSGRLSEASHAVEDENLNLMQVLTVLSLFSLTLHSRFRMRNPAETTVARIRATDQWIFTPLASWLTVYAGQIQSTPRHQSACGKQRTLAYALGVFPALGAEREAEKRHRPRDYHKKHDRQDRSNAEADVTKGHHSVLASDGAKGASSSGLTS